MPLLLSYCLKFSVSIALVFLFYQLVLRRLTFYNWNRYYLLGYILLSFVVAFIDISPILQQKELSENQFVRWIPILNSSEIISTNESGSNFLTAWNIISLLFLAGMIIMFFRLMIQLFSFHRMMKKAEPISIGEMSFFQVNDSIIPFSFGRSIFLNRHLHTEEELKEIIRHEFVHVKQKHSIDIIIGEILCLFNWYNPFAWLLKASIRQNLEFIADDKVLENGINKKEYQYLLLKVIGNNQFSIASKFNFSSLKKRIAMMNKINSARVHLLRFLFILPLLAVLLVAFRSKSFENLSIKTKPSDEQSSKVRVYPSTQVIYADTTPKPSTNKKEIDLSRVSDDYEITDDRAVIHLKNGTTEEYDLKNKEQRKKFEEKYGKIISATMHNGPTTTVSVVTAEGIKTAITPVTVVKGSTSTIVTPVTVSGVGRTVTAATTVNGATIVTPVATSNAVTVIDDNGYIITGNEDIVITITKNTTPQQLEEFKKQMKEKGIELNFDETTYNAKGILTHVSGTMKTNDANGNFSATDFDKVFLATIKKGEETYFKVSVQDKKKVVI